MDGLELYRPIRFTGLPETTNQIRTPLLFVGTEHPDMSKYDDRRTGGALRFEGYLLWCPLVVPVEHNGVLVRIGDASGSLFDATFMKYQVSEQKRREQVSAEVFVHEGMDAALNIDRESFNHSHPHYQYIAKWLHSAFRQFATRHKAIGAEIRKVARTQSFVVGHRSLSSLAEELVSSWTDGVEKPIPVKFEFEVGVAEASQSRSIRVLKDDLLQYIGVGNKVGPKQLNELGLDAERLRAIVQLLYASGVLDRLPLEQQDRLIQGIVRLLFFRVES